MAFLSHLSNWPITPIDYEKVLACYRQRLPSDTGQANDQRWLGHWNSIRHLDCERDYACESAAELERFQVAQASERCRLVAATSGEALWPIVMDENELEGALGLRAELEQHLDECAYCRLLADDLRSELTRQQNGLPPGELTLRDWLLDHYVRERLAAITRQLLPPLSDCLAEVQQLQQSLQASPAASQHLLHSDPVTVASRTVARNVQIDSHFYIAGGANDRADNTFHCSPVWYTKLFAPPAWLRWTATRDEHQFQLQVRVPAGDTLFEHSLQQPFYRLTADDVAKIPVGRSIKWSISDFGNPIFSAVFSVLTDAEQQQFRNTCDDSQPPKLVKQLSLAALLWDYQLFDAAIELLRDLQRRMVCGAPGFVVNRMLAGVWRSVRDELEDRRMELPQGAWANEHVTRALEAAYRSLPN